MKNNLMLYRYTFPKKFAFYFQVTHIVFEIDLFSGAADHSLVAID